MHNTYFTLPVLFAMMFAGAAIRQFFVLRHGWKLGRNRHPLPYALVGVAVIAATIFALRPAPVATVSIAEGRRSEPAAPVSYSDVQKVLEQRCYLCHGAAMQMKNMRLDSPEQLKAHAQSVYQHAVVTRIMPMNNATGITEAERALVGRWLQSGAPVQ